MAFKMTSKKKYSAVARRRKNEKALFNIKQCRPICCFINTKESRAKSNI